VKYGTIPETWYYGQDEVCESVNGRMKRKTGDSLIFEQPFYDLPDIINKKAILYRMALPGY
jgi:hypothetical protein